MTSAAQWDAYLSYLRARVRWELEAPSGDYPIHPGVRRELATALGMDQALAADHDAGADEALDDEAWAAHQLAADHEFQEDRMSENYFTRLGMATARAIAKDTLKLHISGPMARDAALPMGYSPSFDQQEPDDDNDGTGIIDPSGEQCLAFVRTALQRLQEPDRSQFLSGLAGIVGAEQPEQPEAQDGHGHGQGRANVPAYGNGGRDQAVFTRTAQAARTRPPAQDRALAGSSNAFARRWPSIAKVGYW